MIPSPRLAKHRIVLLVAAAALLSTVGEQHAAGGTETAAARYTGGAKVAWGGTLTGRVAVPDVAAVTFLIDGEPYVSDTTFPYVVPLIPETVAPGRHVVTVVAVRRDGTRLRSRTTSIQVARGSVREIVASPGRRFAAAAEALSRGHVTVRLLPGLYRNVALRLGTGSVLVGGEQVVLAPPAGGYTSVVFVAGDDVSLSGITIDGRGQGGGDGHAIEVGPSRHVLVRKVRVRHTRTDGVNIWGKVDDASVQDSSFDGDGAAAAGVVAGISDTGDLSVMRTRLSRFREFGINFAQTRFDLTARGLRNVALDNTITDIRAPIDTQGRNQGGIWSGGARAAIIGNSIARTGWDGIETVGTSTGVTIARNDVRSTRTGIYLEHATNRSSVRGNTIRSVRVGVNVEWRYGGVGSANNFFLDNHIAPESTGIFIDTGSDGNFVKNNVIATRTASAIVLQGSSHNTAAANVACGRSDPAIKERVGLAEDGHPVHPKANRMSANRGEPSCRWPAGGP